MFQGNFELLLEALRIFLRFDFCPQLDHPSHLKSGVHLVSMVKTNNVSPNTKGSSASIISRMASGSVPVGNVCITNSFGFYRSSILGFCVN